MLFVCTCRFEQLALEYDSDELGDLDELEGGGASLEDFQDVLTECLAEQQSSQYISASVSHDSGGNACKQDRPEFSSAGRCTRYSSCQGGPPALGP